MARYGQEFKDKAVARLLPPESATVEAVALYSKTKVIIYAYTIDVEGSMLALILDVGRIP